MALLTHEIRVWVPGYPLSQRGKGKHRTWYYETIRTAARQKFAQPIDRSPIEIEIVFREPEPGKQRPDVDNIAKEIADSLKGIAYPDDALIPNPT